VDPNRQVGAGAALDAVDAHGLTALDVAEDFGEERGDLVSEQLVVSSFCSETAKRCCDCSEQLFTCFPLPSHSVATSLSSANRCASY
jgi:hypothetical protein